MASAACCRAVRHKPALRLETERALIYGCGEVERFPSGVCKHAGMDSCALSHLVFPHTMNRSSLGDGLKTRGHMAWLSHLTLCNSYESLAPGLIPQVVPLSDQHSDVNAVSSCPSPRHVYSLKHAYACIIALGTCLCAKTYVTLQATTGELSGD